MGTTSEKLAYLVETKEQIKEAIIEKGGTIDDDTTFRDYSVAISELPSGGGSSVVLITTNARNVYALTPPTPVLTTLTGG